jgi:translation initiation factor IF-1
MSQGLISKGGKKGRRNGGRQEVQYRECSFERHSGAMRIESYAHVTKALGNGRFSVRIEGSDKDVVMGIIGKLHNNRSQRIEVGDYVLTELGSEGGGVIVFRYSADQVRQLVKDFLIGAAFVNPDSTKVAEVEVEDSFVFEDI